MAIVLPAAALALGAERSGWHHGRGTEAVRPRAQAEAGVDPRAAVTRVAACLCVGDLVQECVLHGGLIIQGHK